MQDVHWSAGLFGYFPTYTLGNVIAAQLWEHFGTLNPDRDRQVASGEFGMLLSWLRSELHQYGRAFKTQEMVHRITTSRVDPAPYLQYLEQKFGDIYGV